VKTELVITASSNIPVRRKALEVFLISLNFFRNLEEHKIQEAPVEFT
jgi:hypothetical protein